MQRYPEAARCAPNVPGNLSQNPSQNGSPLGPVERFVPLVRTPAERMETRFASCLGRESCLWLPGPGEPRVYRLTDGAGRRLEISFDPRRSGSGSRTAAPGRPVRAVCPRTGRQSQADGRAVVNRPARLADPVKVQQAVEAYRTGQAEAARGRWSRRVSEEAAPRNPGRRLRAP